MEAPAGQSPVPPGAWKVLVVTSAAVFVGALDTSVLFVAFPDIRRTFDHVTPAQLSWVINAYTIIFAALLVPSGRLADRVGRKRVFFAGVAVFTVSSALAGIAPSPWFLVGARASQAVGAALLFPASLALVLNEFPRSRRAMAVGIWGAVGALAAATGPSLGALIVDTFGWRWVFYMNVPVGIAAVMFGSRILAESRDPEAGRRPDLVGVPLLIGAVAAVALGIVQSDEWGWLDARTVAAFSVGAVLTPVFLWRSATHPSPTLDLSLFANRNYRIANMATAVFGVVFAGMFFGLIIFLTAVWQYPILKAGLLITPGPLIAAIVAGPAGRLADRLGHRPIMVPGGLAFAGGNAWLLARADMTPDLAGTWFPALILTGIGVGLVLPALSSAAVHGLPPGRFAIGSAVNQTVRQIGFAIGVAITIAIIGTRQSTALLDAYDYVFLMLVVGGLLTSLISSALDTRPRPLVEATPVPDEPPSVEPAPEEGMV